MLCEDDANGTRWPRRLPDDSNVTEVELQPTYIENAQEVFEIQSVFDDGRMTAQDLVRQRPQKDEPSLAPTQKYEPPLA